MTVRVWLRANGYNDVAETIDDILAEFKAKGSRERRNWADVLCGNKGKPVTIAGRTLPMLASAQVSRGLPVSPDAIQRSRDEEFPVARRSGRWADRRQLATVTTRRVARKTSHPRHARAS